MHLHNYLHPTRAHAVRVCGHADGPAHQGHQDRPRTTPTSCTRRRFAIAPQAPSPSARWASLGGLLDPRTIKTELTNSQTARLTRTRTITITRTRARKITITKTMAMMTLTMTTTITQTTCQPHYVGLDNDNEDEDDNEDDNDDDVGPDIDNDLPTDWAGLTDRQTD